MRPESDNTGNPSTSVGAANPQAGSITQESALRSDKAGRPLSAAAIPDAARESAPAPGPISPAVAADASAARSRIGLSETAPSALRPQRQHLGAAGAVVPNEEPTEGRPASLREVEQEG